MELILSAIVIGLFMLAAVWLKHYLGERSKQAQVTSSTEKKIHIFNENSSTFFRSSIVQCAATVIALVFCLYDVESVVISSPIVSFIGFVVAWIAYRSKFIIGISIGLSAPSITLLCLLLIIGLDWGPADAEYPILIIVALYTAILLLAITYINLQRTTRKGPNN